MRQTQFQKKASSDGSGDSWKENVCEQKTIGEPNQPHHRWNKDYAHECLCDCVTNESQRDSHRGGKEENGGDSAQNEPAHKPKNAPDRAHVEVPNDSAREGPNETHDHEGKPLDESASNKYHHQRKRKDDNYC